jgi:hypothetical protein
MFHVGTGPVALRFQSGMRPGRLHWKLVRRFDFLVSGSTVWAYVRQETSQNL